MLYNLENKNKPYSKYSPKKNLALYLTSKMKTKKLVIKEKKNLDVSIDIRFGKNPLY